MSIFTSAETPHWLGSSAGSGLRQTPRRSRLAGSASDHRERTRLRDLPDGRRRSDQQREPGRRTDHGLCLGRDC